MDIAQNDNKRREAKCRETFLSLIFVKQADFALCDEAILRYASLRISNV